MSALAERSNSYSARRWYIYTTSLDQSRVSTFEINRLRKNGSVEQDATPHDNMTWSRIFHRNIYNRWLVVDTHIGLFTSHGVVTPGPRHSRFTLSTRKIVLSPGSLNSTFETISFTKLDPNLIIQFQTKMHVVLNEFLILNSRLNIQSYSRTRTSGETSSSRRRPPFLLHFLLLVLLSTAAGRSTNQSKISSSSYMYVLLNQQNLVFFFCCWKSVWRF